MEKINYNHSEMPPVTVPRMNQYKDSDYYRSQYEPFGYTQPIHCGGADLSYLQPGSIPFATGGTNIMPRRSLFSYDEQSLSQNNRIPCRAGPAADHLDGSGHYPELFDGSSNWVGSEDCYSLPTYQSNICHSLYSNDKHFYHQDDGFLGFHSTDHSRYFYPNNVAYPSSYHSWPPSMNSPLPGYFHNLYKKGCDRAVCNRGDIQDTFFETDVSQPNTYPTGVEKSRYEYEDPCESFDEFDPAKPFGWDKYILPNEENVRSYNRGLPSKQNSSHQKHKYECQNDSKPTETQEVASSLKALESTGTNSAKESGEGSETRSIKLAPSDTKPASRVETEKRNESTPKKAKKEKINKAKPSPRRQKRSKKHSTPIFHIIWDGFGEQENEPVAQACQLCEEDLSIAPVDDNHCEYYELIDEPRNYPEVSVLPCGHAYHTPCLDQATPEELFGDPICFICLSCES